MPQFAHQIVYYSQQQIIHCVYNITFVPNLISHIIFGVKAKIYNYIILIHTYIQNDNHSHKKNTTQNRGYGN